MDKQVLELENHEKKLEQAFLEKESKEQEEKSAKEEKPQIVTNEEEG